VKWAIEALRDLGLLVLGFVLAYYEVTKGGGRPAVLMFISSILLSPVALRVDKYKREKTRDDRNRKINK